MLFRSDEKDTFKEILSLEKIDCTEVPAKIIIFAKEPSFYKIVWDNTYSWVNKKDMRIRVSVLKADEPEKFSYNEDAINIEINNEEISTYL